MSEKCETCLFWRRWYEEKGFCRRYPPRPKVIAIDCDTYENNQFRFIPVTSDEWQWCGEYSEGEGGRTLTKIYTTSDVARMFKVSSTLVRKLIKDGGLKASLIGAASRKDYRIRHEDLEDYLARNRFPPDDEAATS